MATLREFQLALRDKIELVHQREELILELEEELAEKDAMIVRLQLELKRLRSSSGSTSNVSNVGQQQNGNVANGLNSAPNSAPITTNSGSSSSSPATPSVMCSNGGGPFTSPHRTLKSSMSSRSQKFLLPTTPAIKIHRPLSKTVSELTTPSKS